ncbi:hypothetical protein [Streptomyces stackebrandtii]|uniref:hypothetical protein n=1 Tax=Streptomyces stackebrandtii TaxID=3051177 RepID=UPI0028DC2993|nr:hypothetical protein [Streptomyces sp. DSM 40976]
MLEDLLAKRVRYLREQAEHHDTDSFMDRLAARIAGESRRPARVSYAVTDTVQRRVPDRPHADVEARPVLQLRPPAPGPDAAAAHPRGSTRPARRRLRRRPTPIIAPDPAASKLAVLAYVQLLCEHVLRSNDIDTLADFAANYDEVGARTFACLLYSLDRRESALYWWRFAAGVGDPLAAHLLAAHHAAVGQEPDARAWRASAQLLGFTNDHLPQPVRHSTEIAEGFAKQMPWDTEMRFFMGSARLPEELVR